jgi:hypothetical protein
MMTQAFGKPVSNPRTIAVSAHTMNINVKERPFMRPSLAENKDKIRNDLRDSIMEVIK